LLLHSFRSLRRLGCTAVGLSVQADNPTGAVRLYESVGMRRVSERVIYEKRLSGAPAF
jgi:ribosomal protein S18 acetylase RimI-like enzyme